MCSILLHLGGLPKVFLRTFHDILPRKRVTKVRLVSLDTLKKVSVTNVIQHVVSDACGQYYAMFYLTHGNKHSQLPKNY